jgi:hypothetical protein
MNFPSYFFEEKERRGGQTSDSDVWPGWSVLKIKNKILKWVYTSKTSNHPGTSCHPSYPLRGRRGNNNSGADKISE